MIAELTVNGELLPPVLFEETKTVMGFDPYAHNPLFDPPNIADAMYETGWTMRAAIEIAAGTAYTSWTRSDAAGLIAWLDRDEPTTVIEGTVVGDSYHQPHEILAENTPATG